MEAEEPVARRVPKPPAGLHEAGKALWTGILKTYDLRVDELRVLEDAAREADLVADMQSAVDEYDFTFLVDGSMGQPVIHPLVPEIRHHRSTLQRLLASLKLPDEGTSTGAMRADSVSEKARKAQNVRWGNV